MHVGYNTYTMYMYSPWHFFPAIDGLHVECQVLEAHSAVQHSCLQSTQVYSLNILGISWAYHYKKRYWTNPSVLDQVYPRDMPDHYIYNGYSLYIPCIYMVYTWFIQWCTHIKGIYMAYTMYIPYTWYVQWSLHIHFICSEHTMYNMCIYPTRWLMLQRRAGRWKTLT